METQMHPQKTGALVFERRIYDGPTGAGFIIVKWRVTGTDLQINLVHTGPENRNYPPGWNVFATEDGTKPSGYVKDGEDCFLAGEIRKIIDGTHIWMPNTGTEVI